MSFIVIEGTDGSGKGTQTKKLIDRLQSEGKQVETISFPQYGKPSAAMVEEYLHGKLGTSQEVGPYRASMLFAIDRYGAKQQIEKWLSEGKTVIADRYVGSNMAHQGGKMSNEQERQSYFSWNYTLEYETFGIPKPDINIILHMSAATSFRLIEEKQSRAYLKGKERDMHEADINHLIQAEQTYLSLAKTFDDFTVIECENENNLRTIDDIHDEIYTLVLGYMTKNMR